MNNKWSPRPQSNYSAVQQQIEVPEQLEPTLTISVPSPSSTTNRFIFLTCFWFFSTVFHLVAIDGSITSRCTSDTASALERKKPSKSGLCQSDNLKTFESNFKSN